MNSGALPDRNIGKRERRQIKIAEIVSLTDD